MQRLKNRIFKSFISVFMALMIIVLSLCNSFGRVTLMPAQRTDAIAVVDDAVVAASIGAFFTLMSLGYVYDNYDEIVSDFKAWGDYTADGWKEILDAEEGTTIDAINITQDMVDDMARYMETKQLYNKDGFSYFDIGQNASSWLLEKCSSAYMAIASAGYGDELASMKRFYVEIRGDNLSDYFTGNIGAEMCIIPVPDTVVGIIYDDGICKYVLNDGSISDAYSYDNVSQYIRTYCDSGNWVSTWLGSSKVVNIGDYENTSYIYSESKGFYRFFSSGSTQISYFAYGLPMWLAPEDYYNGVDPVASNPDYGLTQPIAGMALDIGADVADELIGISVPKDYDYEALNDAIITAGQKAYEDAVAAGATAEGAQEAASIAASATANDALADISNKLGDSSSGIMGLLNAILAALTSTGLFALLMTFYESFTDFVSKVIDGSIFASIIAAIEALPATIIAAIEAVPESIGAVISSVLTALGLSDLAEAIGAQFSKVLSNLGLAGLADAVAGAVSGSLEWIMDIPQQLSGSLEWIMDIPQSLANAVSSALEWIMDIPQSLANAVSGALEWIMDIPQTIADAISGALEWLQDLVISIPGIQAVLDWLILDIAAITAALAGIKALVLERVSLPFPSNPFLPFTKKLPVEYPVVTMPTPEIFKPFLAGTEMESELLLIDFSDFQEYCQTVRTLLRGILWFSFVLYLIKSHKIDLSIS